MRIFIALNCNAEKEYFQSLQKQIPSGKITFPNDFHITLKFLGEVSDKQYTQICKAIERIVNPSFLLKLGMITSFNKRVIVLEEYSKETILLQKKIDDSLFRLFPKETQFQSHITLARIKAVQDDSFFEQVKKIQTEEKALEVSTVEIVQSTLTAEGPVYTVLYEKKLT